MREAQKEYIITARQLAEFESYYPDVVLEPDRTTVTKMGNAIRSRPYKSDAVLDDLDKKCYEQISFLSGAGSSERIAYKQVRLWIAEFRSQQKER